MSSIKNLPTDLITPFNSNLFHDGTVSPLKKVVQKRIDSVVQKDKSRKDGAHLPSEILSEILRHLNPPNIKNLQKGLSHTQDWFCELNSDTLKQDYLYWHRLKLPQPIDSPSKITLEQTWFAAFNEMPQPMKTMYIDANLCFDVFNAFDPEEIDYMHRAAITVDKAVQLLGDGEWLGAKKLFATAEDFAKQAGNNLPACAYKSAMNACVDEAVRSIERRPWFHADGWTSLKEGFSTAEFFSQKAGEPMPACAYESAMNACVSRAVVFYKQGYWSNAEEGIDTAKFFSQKAGKDLPVSTYESLMKACVDGTVKCVKEGFLDVAHVGVAAAKYFAQKAGTTLPDSAYERFMKPCVDDVVKLFREGSWSDAYKKLVKVESLAKEADRPSPANAYERVVNACLVKIVKLFREGSRSDAKRGFTATEDFAERCGKTLPASAYESAMNACVDRASIEMKKDRDWFYFTDYIITAEFFAQKANRTLPDTVLELVAKYSPPLYFEMVERKREFCSR